MENASKALIIAGAILISILIIAIGMFIYQSALAPVQSAASQMGQQDKQMYNSMIEKYIGTKKGTEVKQMINEIISQNNQYVGETGKFIAIDASNIMNNATPVEEQAWNYIGEAADAYASKNGTQGTNDQTNIDKATKAMRKVSEKIIAGKNYTVSADDEGSTTDGIIHKVKITPYSSN